MVLLHVYCVGAVLHPVILQSHGWSSPSSCCSAHSYLSLWSCLAWRLSFGRWKHLLSLVWIGGFMVTNFHRQKTNLFCSPFRFLVSVKVGARYPGSRTTLTVTWLWATNLCIGCVLLWLVSSSSSPPLWFESGAAKIHGLPSKTGELVCDSFNRWIFLSVSAINTSKYDNVGQP